MPTPAESRDFLAEDVGLPPDHMFTAMLKASALTPDTFATNAALEWSEIDPSILGTLFEITLRCGEPSTTSLPAVQPDPIASPKAAVPTNPSHQLPQLSLASQPAPDFRACCVFCA